jgi:hypothetical protein
MTVLSRACRGPKLGHASHDRAPRHGALATLPKAALIMIARSRYATAPSFP